MPRPRPLTGIQSSNDYALYQAPSQLTPRTPHSRAGRAEEAYTEVELEQVDDETQQQNQPLLRSSASDRFSSSGAGYRSHGDEANKVGGLSPKAILERIPIAFGTMIAGLLFVLLVVSYKKPGTIEKYVGVKTTVGESSTAGNLISYENYTQFPLKPKEYVSECDKLTKGWMSSLPYWQGNKTLGVMDVLHSKDSSVCSSTITYMLDGRRGLVADLALMAQAAALARERNRTFLIDDTYWDRGKWTDHFEDVRTTQPGPEPGCKPPPPEELVACPRLARHWLINSGTAKFHFAHGFLENYEDPYGRGLNRAKPMFDMALESFSSTIKPNTRNTELIQSVRDELPAEYIAVHIRRGDYKPSSWNYVQKGEIPIEDYADAAEATWKRLMSLSSKPAVYVASDSPRAQQAFSDAFMQGKTYTLANSKHAHLASPEQYFQNNFEKLYDLDQRIELTRGMVVDLALLNGLWSQSEDVRPQAVICTISSTICKISAIGFGWEGAFGHVNDMGNSEKQTMRWIEIDEKGSVEPLWSAFNLF